jgi:outer membrane protein
MKRYLALGTLGLGLMVSPLLSGLAGSAVPANPKIGVINIEQTLSTTPAGKRANEAFEKTRKAKQADLDKRQDALKKADAYAVKQAELEKQFVDLQQTYVKLERELASDRTKLIQDLLKQAEPLIAKIAKAEGVHLIVDANATVWTDPSIDLTAKLNAEMK